MAIILHLKETPLTDRYQAELIEVLPADNMVLVRWLDNGEEDVVARESFDEPEQ